MEAKAASDAQNIAGQQAARQVIIFSFTTGFGKYYTTKDFL